ncbi:MAG: hypothetical protein K2X94_04570 [Amoebophilaceae bacterium]|nr:hypothetical protein [Amoebophilaceae bacterium]
MSKRETIASWPCTKANDTAQAGIIFNAITNILTKEDPLTTSNKKEAVDKNHAMATATSKAFDVITDNWCKIHIAHSFHIMHAIHAINTSLKKVKDRSSLADAYEAIKRHRAIIDQSVRVIQKGNAKHLKELNPIVLGKQPIYFKDDAIKSDNRQVNELVAVLEGILNHAGPLTTYRCNVSDKFTYQKRADIAKQCKKDIDLVKDHIAHNDTLASAIYVVRSTTNLVLNAYRAYETYMPHPDKAHYKATKELLDKQATMASHSFKQACTIFDIIQQHAPNQDKQIRALCEQMRKNKDLASKNIDIDHDLIIDITDHASQVIEKTRRIVNRQYMTLHADLLSMGISS